MQIAAGDSEAGTDGELQHGIDAEVICNLEEIAAFLADRAFQNFIGSGAELSGGGLPVLKVACAADCQIAAAHEIDAEVDAVITLRATIECILVTDAEIGLGVVPAVLAGDFSNMGTVE